MARAVAGTAPACGPRCHGKRSELRSDSSSATAERLQAGAATALARGSLEARIALPWPRGRRAGLRRATYDGGIESCLPGQAAFWNALAMARKDDSNLLSRITTALARMDDRSAIKVPSALATDVKEFRSAVGPFIAAAAKAAEALAARDEALEKVGDADAALDASIDDLADGCVGGKVGKRTSPFAGLSSYSPSALKNLAYKTEVDAVGALLVGLAKKNPPAAVKALAAKVQKNAATVQKLLDAVTGPEARYIKARAAREALVSAASKAYGRFKLRAKAALLDEAGAYEALFVGRAAVQAPARRKAKPKTAVGPKPA